MTTTMKMMLLLGVAVSAVSGAVWEYSGTNGPANWPPICNSATSLKQSPINLKDAVSATFSAFSFSGYGNVDASMTNNGHTVVVTLDPSSVATMTGGGLQGSYRLAQFHFHWGCDDETGSEHFIDDDQFPMEVHFVHYNTLYSSLGQAADQPDGLAVLSWMFEVDDDDYTPYNVIFNNLVHVNTVGSAAYPLTNLDLLQLMGDPQLDFYRYEGSLTTPNCYESVKWTVFEDPIQISDTQLAKMLELEDSHHHVLCDNFRPLQPLNGRQIQYTG